MYLRRALIAFLSIFAVCVGSRVMRADDATEVKKPASCVPSIKDRPRHDAFLKDKEELLKKGPIQVVFIGDSITDGWRGGGHAVWEKNYAKYNALNLGIGGDRTEHVLWRMQNGELDGLDPKAIVLMIGTNNGGSPAEDIIAGIKCDVDVIHAKVPNAKILLLAVFPRSPKATDGIRTKLKGVNEAISKLDGKDNVKYLDIGDKFLEPDGTLLPTIMPDFLHPNEKGYGIWAEAIQPSLDEMVK